MLKQPHGLLPEPLLKTFTHNFEIHPTIPDSLATFTNLPFLLLCLPKVFLCQHLKLLFLSESIKNSPILRRLITVLFMALAICIVICAPHMY